MARILDANEKFTGKEPKVVGILTDNELGSILSWYSQNKKSRDSLKYASDFFKKNHKLNISPALKGYAPQFGFICRVLMNGSTLSDERQEWFNNQVNELKEKLSKIKTVEVIEVVKKGPNIQERIFEKSSECIGELEGQIDELVLSKFEKTVSPYAMMHSMEIKSVHTKHISDWFKTKRVEFDDVLHTDDAQVKEGWSNFTKPQMKKLVAYCDQVILDCGKIAGEAVKSRKPRKRKTKTPEQLVAKIKVMEEHKELKLKSVPTKDILGAMQLWIFNTKNRKLGCYHAIDADGLSVKGSSIINFNESKSVQKTLRKPEATLPEIIKGGKVYLRNALEGIRAVESGLTGRLNADTILVRIVK